jgi:subtilisin
VITPVKVKLNSSIYSLLSGFYASIFLGGVIVFFTCFIFVTSAIANEKKIIFDNFSSQLEIIKRDASYYVQGTNIQVQLTNRVIVKTVSNANKQSVLGFHNGISKVTELFHGEKNNFYSLTLKKDNHLSEVLFDLKNVQKKNPEKGILLVQPDILQRQSKAETSVDKKQYLSIKKPKPNNAYRVQSPYIELLNIHHLWRKTKGENTKVAIIDDGIFLEHSELKHIKPLFSYDVENKRMSSMPIISHDTHGTKVAGIIFSAHDNIGIDGIAPAADLISIRQPSTWTSNTLLSFQLANLMGAQIINCSWHSQLLLQPIADIVDDLAKNGRKGKGTVVVISAGNNGKKITKNSIESAIESAIVVGASGKKFQHLAYSNYGPTVDFYTYGQRVKTTLSSGGYGVFSGTSLAAAVVSGVSALLLSHKPELTIDQLSKQLKLIIEPPVNNRSKPI